MMTPHLGDLLNDKVNAIIEEATKYATEVIEQHKNELTILVNALLDKGILSKEEIDKLISR
jgi:ATP-dependent Zn protease